MYLYLSILLALVLVWSAFRGTSAWIWMPLLLINIFIWIQPSFFIMVIVSVLALLLITPAFRAPFISRHIMSAIKTFHLLPKISDTEKLALRAGDVWLDGEFFSGKPDFGFIYKNDYKKLSKQEALFLKTKVETVCKMTDDYKVFAKRDLSEEVWEYLKKEHFFGMIIPVEYGGLGFSALGHSSVIQKMATRSQVLAITTMVPNSLGPAELILHYGTKKQKDHYLPRLADGRDIPCFALTEPLAGSDATSIQSSGVVFKDKKGTIKIRLNFEKRYITLGAIASLIGLAFVLRDPEHILGDEEELGITCALVDASLKGVIQGRRHDPLGVPFINSPLNGKDVVIGIDDVIGAQEGIGEGWKMLMESLAVGRGISLPSTSCGGVKLSADVAGKYALIREQFGLSIGRFEGIGDVLARLAATTYALDAARIFTIGAIDAGKKPAVINAVMKYHATEMFRDAVNDGMDIVGGAGISLGERNFLGHAYMGAPIAITVEGANIMTRTLIQFGQGLIRCHPYVYSEIEAFEANDVMAFDKNFFNHVGFTLRNGVRALLLSLTRGYLYLPVGSGIVGKYERRLVWSSAMFAFLSDIMMAYYGGELKRKEQITARFGDILSYMYLLTATLRRYKEEGYHSDTILVEYNAQLMLSKIQEAYEALFSNIGRSFVSRFFFGTFLRFFIRLNRFSAPPSDHLALALADRLLETSEARDRLCEGVYAGETGDAIVNLNKVFMQVHETLPLFSRIKTAIKDKKLSKNSPSGVYYDALEKGVITKEEYAQIMDVKQARTECVQVDSYEVDAYINRGV